MTTTERTKLTEDALAAGLRVTPYGDGVQILRVGKETGRVTAGVVVSGWGWATDVTVDLSATRAFRSAAVCRKLLRLSSLR